MDANKSGVAFSKAELRMLREFASKEPTDRDRYGVQISVEGDRVFARASTSRIHVQLDGISDGKLPNNEHFVDMKFLIDGRKELEGKQLLRLNFKGASLFEATIEENKVPRLTITTETDAAISKPTFPQLAKTLKKPSARRERVHCVALSPAYLRAATLAAAASEGTGEELIEFFPPSTPDGLMVFEIGSDKETSIRGGIMANVTAEALASDEEDEDAVEDDEKPKAKRARKGNGKQPALPNVNAETAS